MTAEYDPLLLPLTSEILDTTLRDGSYAVDFQFDENFVVELMCRLDATPIQKIEIAHGVGYEAERAGNRPGSISLRRWCELAGTHLRSSTWGVFAQPSFSRLETMSELVGAGMSFVRVGMEAEKVAANLDYLRRATEICGQVYLNLMKSSSTPYEALPDLLKAVPREVAGVYVVDSYGSMLPSDVHRYVTVVQRSFPVVGFHGHNNLGLANANSIAALTAGASIVDGTLHGFGRGSGNAETESLAGILKVKGDDRYDYRELSRMAEFCREHLDVLPDNRNMQVLGGVLGVHSNYYQLVEDLCEQHRLDPASVMEKAAGLATRSIDGADIRAAAELLSAPATVGARA
ncbi:hypothetical protein AB0A63_32460 [Lentzea sp. NPDC042327]|uniref:hypothetical protein n=1 Tax=Lentzea sp. NPDC042327 TaxID=3154801 RepID=UPI0033E9BC98